MKVLLNGLEQHVAGVDGFAVCELERFGVRGAKLVQRGGCGVHEGHYDDSCADSNLPAKMARGRS